MYCIAGNFRDVKFHVFRDLIQFAKVYLRNCYYKRTNANYQHTNSRINNVKCLFQHENMKYSSANFSRYTVEPYLMGPISSNSPQNLAFSIFLTLDSTDSIAPSPKRPQEFDCENVSSSQ